jgi:hypothetical protein
MVTLEAHRTVIFCCILLPFKSYKGLDLSFQEQKTESIYLNWISFYPFFLMRKTLFSQKFYTLLCALLKIRNCIGENGKRYLKKFQQLCIQQAKNNFSM